MCNDAREWAYISKTLLAEPEYRRIERDAIELLGRALNSRPVIAFVGAGASMAYGRISWGDTVLAMQRRVLDRANRAEKAFPNETANWTRLRNMLEVMNVQPGNTVDSKDFLVAFQLAEELWRLLPNKVPDDLEGDFREQVMDLLQDDRGHAEQIINYALRERVDGTLDPNTPRIPLQAPIEQAGETTEDFRRFDYLETVCKKVLAAVGNDTKARSILLTLKQSWPTAKDSGTDYIRPYHRFLIGVMLRLIPPEKRKDCIGAPYWNPTKPARGQVVPADRDPLILLLRLRITRFLTTNYDQEVEQLFRSEGLIQKTEHAGENPDDTDGQSPHHQLGRSWRDLVFDKSHVGRMLAFAAGDGRKLAEVVHLHGRADKTSDITVTTEDYQRRYITADDLRPGMEDALSAAFGGNPVLFVGSGMGEDDLLRPLRQFVGETGLNPDRLSVALLPAKYDYAKLHMEKIVNLQRYGVYTIHYGSAEVTLPAQKSSAAIPAIPEVSKASQLWLTRLEQLRRTIEGVLDAAAKPLRDQWQQNKSAMPWNGYPGATLRRACQDISEKASDPLIHVNVTTEPVKIESIDLNAHPALRITMELTVFRLSLDLVRELSETSGFRLADWKSHGGESLLRRIICLRFALAGAMDSITGAFLCSMLMKLGDDAHKWGRQWLDLPQPEDANENVRNAIAKLCHTRGTSRLLWQRHAVYLAESRDDPGDEDLESYRFYSNAPSQTFNHLRASLDESKIKVILASPPRARRIFLFATKRGVGKGHYFAALTNPDHLEKLCLAMGQPLNGLKWPAAFFNFSFSHETSSIFDQITEFLLCGAEEILLAVQATATQSLYQQKQIELWKRQVEEVRRDANDLSPDRLGRLKLVLSGLANTTLLSKERRILVALSGLSMLYDRQGFPKNAQAGRLVNLLIGEASLTTPIDLLIFAGENWIPRAFRDVALNQHNGTDRAIDLVEIKRKRLSPKLDRALERRRAVLRMRPVSALLEDTSPRDQAFVHFLHGTRASVMMAAFFPSVALAIGLRVGLKDIKLPYFQPQTCPRDPSVNTRFGRLRKSQFSTEADYLGRKQINIFLQSGEKADANGRIEEPKKYFPRMIAFGAYASALGRIWYEEFPWKWRDRAEETRKLDRNNFRVIAGRIDYWLRNLYSACGESRFAFTVLTATAYQYLLPVAVRTDRDITPPMIADAIDACVDFLEKTRFELEGRPAERRPAAIIDTAIRTIVELDAQVHRGLPGQLSFLTSGPGISQLQEVILWQLAVIGQPVTRDVLVHSPLIVGCCKSHRNDWESRKQKTSPGSESAFLNEAVGDCLRLLEQRCLVFRLRPRVPSTHANQGKAKYRYAVHRFVQRHVFVNLQSPFVEYNEADQFAITLFASQPKDVPRLTARAYQDLRRTVAALIGFPDVGDYPEDLACWAALPQRKEGETEWVHATKLGPAISQHAEMLRAALGMVRSIFSLAIISRTDLPPGLGGLSSAGRRSPSVTVLDELRLLLLWMLQQAKTMDCEVNYVKKYSESTPVQRPFYAEEIAWLYNECGVISLTQGRIIDAGHLFERADKTAERFFEPYPEASIRTRIALNKALADIYRGRLQDAEKALTRVQNLADEHPAILCIARGLLGQIDHIRGRYTSAEEHYKWAIEDDGNGHKGLISLDKSRAASIFCRYYGDLFRAREEFDDGEAMLRQAMILAIEGGHEDVRHQARLATVHLEIVRNEKGSEPRALQDGSRLHRELDVIEEYAKSMGMLQLRCATDLIRADLHCYGGDLKGAASVASRGLTLAETHDLRLRKTRFLLRLADIYQRQGQPDQCKPLLEAAFDLARETGYHAAREQGQKLYARIRGGRRATL